MILSQVVMAGVMVITSLYMKDMHHDLGDISMVISAHTIGMYAFSLLSGRLIDRWGRRQVIILGAAILLAACLTAPLTGDTFPLAVSLLLLGLGWNFCFVGGSTLLADQLRPSERGRTQGFNDLLVGLASAMGSLGSGFSRHASGTPESVSRGPPCRSCPFSSSRGGGARHRRGRRRVFPVLTVSAAYASFPFRQGGGKF